MIPAEGGYVPADAGRITDRMTGCLPLVTCKREGQDTCFGQRPECGCDIDWDEVLNR